MEITRPRPRSSRLVAVAAYSAGRIKARAQIIYKETREPSGPARVVNFALVVETFLIIRI